MNGREQAIERYRRYRSSSEDSPANFVDCLTDIIRFQFGISPPPTDPLLHPVKPHQDDLPAFEARVNGHWMTVYSNGKVVAPELDVSMIINRIGRPSAEGRAPEGGALPVEQQSAAEVRAIREYLQFVIAETPPHKAEAVLLKRVLAFIDCLVIAGEPLSVPPAPEPRVLSPAERAIEELRAAYLHADESGLKEAIYPLIEAIDLGRWELVVAQKDQGNADV